MQIITATKIYNIFLFDYRVSIHISGFYSWLKHLFMLITSYSSILTCPLFNRPTSEERLSPERGKAFESNSKGIE